jgi:hypothetical protein
MGPDLQSFFWSETEVVDKLFRILETAFTPNPRGGSETKTIHAGSSTHPGHQASAGSKENEGPLSVKRGVQKFIYERNRDPYAKQLKTIEYHRNFA